MVVCKRASRSMSSGESEIAESFQTVEELEADALEELGELDQAVQALESGKWTGSISAGERDAKREQVAALRVILQKARSADAERLRSRQARLLTPAKDRRENLRQEQQRLGEELDCEDQRESVQAALSKSARLSAEESFSGDSGYPAPAWFPSVQEIELLEDSSRELFAQLSTAAADREKELLVFVAGLEAQLSAEARKLRLCDQEKVAAQLAAQAAQDQEAVFRQQLENLQAEFVEQRSEIADLQAELAVRPARGVTVDAAAVPEPDAVAFWGDTSGWKKPARILQDQIRAQLARQTFANRCTLYRAAAGEARDRDELFELFPFLTKDLVSDQAYQTLNFLVPVLTALTDVVQHFRAGDGVPLVALHGAGFTLLIEATDLLEDYVLFHLHHAKARELAVHRARGLNAGGLAQGTIGERTPMEVKQDFLVKMRDAQQYRDLPTTAEEEREQEERVAETRKLWRSTQIKEQVKADIALLAKNERRESQRFLPAGRGAGGRGGRGRGNAQGAAPPAQGGGSG